MPAPRRSPSLPARDLMRGSRPFILLQNILTYYVDLPAFMILAGDWKTWLTFVTRRQPIDTPMDYEGFSQWGERVRYNERCLARAFSSQKPLCASHRGLHGLFVPILKQGRALGVLQTGVFLRDVPSEAELAALWQDLSGRKPLPHDAAFCSYARAVAGCPVLDDAVVAALTELLELFAAFLTRSLAGDAAARRMDELQKTVFARRLWHHQWVEWQAISPKFFRFNGDTKALMPWEVEELGIARFPTTVLAAKREGTGREWADALAAMDFQREARRVAPELGETLAHPLGYYGTLLLTSADPKASPARAADEISERAARFAGRMARRFGCRVWVGVGGTDPSGTALRASYHEAVAALHLGLARDETVVRYQDLGQAAQGGSGLRKEVEALARAILEQGRAESGRHTGAFIQAVLLKTLGRPEASRRAFMGLLDRLLSALEHRRGPKDDMARFEADITLNLETAFDLNEMVARFESALDLLLSFLERPVAGDKYFRLNKAAQAVEASLNEPWTLPLAAKQFGFSTTTFSREFSRHAGRPFSDFLLAKRLEKAKHLLSSAGLSLEQVAEACGFSSVNYFIQIFKRKVGTPPGKFGRAHLS